MSTDRPSSESAQQLTRQLQRVQDDLDLLVKSGNWLVWSCDVQKVSDTDWTWEFRDDFCKFLPPWFDIERQGNENFAVTLNRARYFEDIEVCDRTSRQALLTGASGYNQTFRVRLRDGSFSWVEENVTIQPQHGGIWHLVGICIDATDRKLAEERLRNLQDELVLQNKELALREMLQTEKMDRSAGNVSAKKISPDDALTGAKSYTAFQEQLNREWHAALRYASPMSVVIVDMDLLHQYNEHFGRRAGDAALHGSARILQDTARETDFIARYGGDEFAVILPRTDGDGAVRLAERFRANIAAAPWEHGIVTASFGIAVITASIPGPQSLLEAADRALHAAKRAGRNRVAGPLPL